MTCCIDNCDNPKKARGMCHKHYERWRKHQDTGTNFKAHEWWRKAQKRGGLIEPEHDRRSYEEIETMRLFFKETVSEDGHTRSYIPDIISCDMEDLEWLTSSKEYSEPEPVQHTSTKHRILSQADFEKIFLDVVRVRINR